MGAQNRRLTRAYRQDATISPVSWGLSGAEIPACEPVALAEVRSASVSGQQGLHLFTHMPTAVRRREWRQLGCSRWGFARRFRSGRGRDLAATWASQLTGAVVEVEQSGVCADLSPSMP